MMDLHRRRIHISAIDATGQPHRIKSAIPTLDGLRGIACLLVILSHAGNIGLMPRIAGTGQLGVMLFFSLSGFLMAHLYAGTGADHSRWTSYLVRRFFRVYPPYIVIVIIGFYIGTFTHPFVYSMNEQELLAHLTLQGSVSVFWTIPVEMRFYLLFPLLCIFATGMSNAKACVFYATVAGAAIYFEPSGPKYSLWPYVSFFALGCCGAHLYRIMSHRPWPYDMILAVLLLTILSSTPIVSHNFLGIENRLWGDAGYFSCLMTATVTTCALASGRVASLLSSAAMRWLGKISFSLYLVHFPILHFVRSVIPPEHALVPAFILAAIIAWLCYLALERPSQSFGVRVEKYLTERAS